MGSVSDERRAEIVRMLSEAVDSLAYDVTTGRYGFDYAVKAYVEANDNELSKMVEGGVPFPMLSDAGGKVGTIYGIYDETGGVETRGRFIIDPDGVIQAMEVMTPPVGRHMDETIRQIQAFQLVRKTEGAEATPSGWRPGKMTLKPGPDLVGRVWEVWNPEMED